MFFPNNSFLESGLLNSCSCRWLEGYSVRKCNWKGGKGRREKDAPKCEGKPQKPRLPLCLALGLPDQQSSGSLPVYGRRELEAGPEVWPDQRLNPWTAKGIEFFEFRAWEVCLEGHRRGNIGKEQLGLSSFILGLCLHGRYSYAPIFAAKGLKMSCLGFPQHAGAVGLPQWSSSICYCGRHWDNLKSLGKG